MIKTTRKTKFKRTFWHSVYAEISKLWSLPFIWVVLIGTLGITITFALIFSINARGSFSGEATEVISLGLTPMTYTQAGIFVFGVIASCSEYIGGQVGTTLTAIPNRIEQRLAATVALIPFAFISAILVNIISVMITYIMFGSGNADFDIWLNLHMIFNSAVYLTLMTILSSAIGTMVRKSIPVVGGVFLYLFVISPLLLGQAFSFYLPDIASYTLWFPNAPEEAPPAIVAWILLIGWTLAFLIASIVIAKRRDS